jgi:glycosyltransferase involved in cell wall biosynthesis
MRLAVNGWRCAHGQLTGIGRYVANLVARWRAEVVAGRFEAVTFYSPRPVDRDQVPLPPEVSERVLRPRAPMLVWENLRFGPSAHEDVLFCPSFSRPLVARGRTVVAIHDATCQLHPELYPRQQGLYNRLYRWGAQRATLVLTSTEAAARDISRLWAVPPTRIRVVPLAAADVFGPMPSESAAGRVAERLLGSPAPYFLFVGKMTGRRRVPLLVESFARFKQATGSPHKLLLVGPAGTGAVEVENLARGHGIGDDVRHSGYVSDEDLNALYNGAIAVVCPSVYETVSLPIMEAQAVGAPVVCVDSPGSRETSGGAALFMPGLTRESLTDALVRMAGDDALRRRLRQEGPAHARQFSWERTARETLDVLEEAAGAEAMAGRPGL